MLTGCYSSGKNITTSEYKIKKNNTLKISNLKNYNNSKTIGGFLKYKKFQNKCKKVKYYEGYVNCVTYKMLEKKKLFNQANYLEEVYNFKAITTLHIKLIDKNILTDEIAFGKMNKILEMPLNSGGSKSFEDDIEKNLTCANNNKQFKQFIKCLDKNIRNQEVYLNSNFLTRSVIERIIGYSQLYLINERFFLTNFTYKLEAENEKDRYQFLADLINYYASSYYREDVDNLIAAATGNVKIPSNAKLMFYKDGKYHYKVPGRKTYLTTTGYKPSIKDKLLSLKDEDYLSSLKSEVDNFDIIDAAFFISTVYLISQGDTPIQKMLSDKNTSSVSTIAQSGKSSSILSANNTSTYRKNMFRYVPKSSVLNKGWFKYGLLRGGF